MSRPSKEDTPLNDELAPRDRQIVGFFTALEPATYVDCPRHAPLLAFDWLVMRITVRAFAQYAEWLGTDRLTLEMPSAAKISDAVQSLRSTGPSGHLLPERPLVALNLEHVRDDRALTEGDELALLPPLAGG